MGEIKEKYTILYHGNCIDGWFAAYIAHSMLQYYGEVKMYPISPSQKNTWPKNDKIVGTHILLVDVSVPEVDRKEWKRAGVLTIGCIDHHESSIDHWLNETNPINIERCATYQTWEYYYPAYPVPYWVEHIDRIDRWNSPTYEDRCIREVLNIIAHKPVQNKLSEAFSLTETFLMRMQTQEGLLGIIREGKVILDKKDAQIMKILSGGEIHIITKEYITNWNLAPSWLNAFVFVIDNTNVTLDSTEAAHVLFSNYPQVNVFVNYRKKTITGKRTMYVYSARSQGFDLTENKSILKGHKTSAGASLMEGEVGAMPFVV